PEELYDFIADDLMRTTSTALQESLFLLALGADRSERATLDLLGQSAEVVLADAAARGLLTSQGRRFEMHPLVRAFLISRLRDLGEKRGRPLVSRALTTMASERMWDECLAVLGEIDWERPGASLLRDALPELLAAGRLATVRRWVELDRKGRVDPIFALAEAEISLREGANTHAQVVAERAAEDFGDGEYAARAHLLAARAAHARDDSVGARRSAQSVIRTTNCEELRADAHWIEFLSSFETQDGNAGSALDRVRSAGTPSAERTIRVHHATAVLALEAEGAVKVAVRELELAKPLLKHVVDPLVKTSFLNAYSTAARYHAQYELALELAEEQIFEA